jgi:hypothetical protein
MTGTSYQERYRYRAQPINLAGSAVPTHRLGLLIWKMQPLEVRDSNSRHLPLSISSTSVALPTELPMLIWSGEWSLICTFEKWI